MHFVNNSDSSVDILVSVHKRMEAVLFSSTKFLTCPYQHKGSHFQHPRTAGFLAKYSIYGDITFSS